MMIKSKLLMAGSAMLFSATMAFGAVTSDQLAAQFQADGYSYITIKTGLTQIKVEAVKSGTLYEMVYDIETGDVIDTSTYSVGSNDQPDPGVIMRTVSRDFEDDESVSGEDDDERDDDNSDDDNDDDSDDDNDDDSDDDSDDDHGGDDD